MSDRQPSQIKQVLDEVRALSCEFSEFKSEVKSDLTGIKTQIDMQPKIDSESFKRLEENESNCKVSNSKQFGDHDRRITQLEGNQRWVVLAILASVIVSVMQLVAK